MATTRRPPGAGSITQRSKDRYRIRVDYYKPDGTRGTLHKSLKCSKKEAEAKKRELEDEAQERSSPNYRGTSDATVQEFIEKWLTTYCATEIKPRTARTYREALYRYLVPHCGKLKIKDMTGAHIQNLYDDMVTKRDLSAQTVHQLHQALSSCLNSSKKLGGLSFIATDDARPPSITHTRASSRQIDSGTGERRERTSWFPEEVSRFYEAASGHRFENLYILAIHTGMRVGEICGLKWTDIDLVSGQLTVSRSLQRITTMGLVPGTPKNGKPRVISLNEVAISALKTEREIQTLRRTMAEAAWADEGWVFSTDTGFGIDSHAVSKHFRKLVRSTTLTDITFHELRHTFASLAALSGSPIENVSRVLGHATIQITLDLYQHLFPSQTQDVVNNIGRLIPRAR